jgi:hypothetical protein
VRPGAGKAGRTRYVLARVVQNSKTSLSEPPTLVVEKTLPVEPRSAACVVGAAFDTPRDDAADEPLR